MTILQQLVKQALITPRWATQAGANFPEAQETLTQRNPATGIMGSARQGLQQFGTALGNVPGALAGLGKTMGNMGQKAVQGLGKGIGSAAAGMQQMVSPFAQKAQAAGVEAGRLRGVRRAGQAAGAKLQASPPNPMNPAWANRTPAWGKQSEAYWQGVAMTLASKGINPEGLLKEAQVWEGIKNWLGNTAMPALRGAGSSVKNWGQNVNWGEMLKKMAPFMAAGGVAGLGGSLALRHGDKDVGWGSHLGAGLLGALAPLAGYGAYRAGQKGWEGMQSALPQQKAPTPPPAPAPIAAPAPDATTQTMQQGAAAQKEEEQAARATAARLAMGNVK